MASATIKHQKVWYGKLKKYIYILFSVYLKICGRNVLYLWRSNNAAAVEATGLRIMFLLLGQKQSKSNNTFTFTFSENVLLPQLVACQVSGVRCHMSGVACQVSGVTCHMSHFILFLFLFYKVVKLVVGGSVINGANPL